MATDKVLVVDDDRTVLHLVRRSLEGPERTVISATTAAEGLALVETEKPDVVLLDIMMPGTSGLDIFTQMRDLDRRLPIVFITASAGSSLAIEAVQLGAFDYVVKPLDLPQLTAVVDKAIETHHLMCVPLAIGAADDPQPGDQFIGRSSKMLDVFKAIGRVASQNVTVLIRGDSGTGKELVARAIYHHSRRQGEPFMAVNCAAIPDTLLESELFGHEKGSFTGAERRRIGKFEQCNGGTIFLDEIGDMSPLVQGKVLRLLQEQSFERVGGNDTIRTDVRVIAATNRDLEAMVARGEYRSDLLYRINGVTISLPPLRERGEDIGMLLKHFLSRARIEMDRHDVEGISPDAVDLLMRYPWPGNVRELQSVVKRAILNCTGPVIVPAFLPPEITGKGVHHEMALAPHLPTSVAASIPEAHLDSEAMASDLRAFVEDRLDAGTTRLYDEAVEMMERYLLVRVLQATGGNQSKAAAILGITRGKIRDRIATFGIHLDKNVSVETA